MADKHEWRKEEKAIYLPKAEPVCLTIPAFHYITIKGEGSPDEERFASCIGALYPLAYTIKMQLKKLADKPKGYQDYTVYPLEGIWDINEEARKNFTGKIRKEDLVYCLMLRQPDFITRDFFDEMKELVRSKLLKKKESTAFVDLLAFESIDEGKCVQMLHVGKFADEDKTFNIMEAYARNKGLTRISKIHREIYLSDFRKVAPEKLKTTLRFQVH